MDFQKKFEIIQEILGEYKKAGQNEYLFFCPECKYGVKLSVNIKKNKFKCWFCLWSGTLEKLVKKLGNESQQVVWFGSLREQDNYDLVKLEQVIKTGKVDEDVAVNNIDVNKEFPHEEYWDLYDKRDYVTAQAPLSYLFSRGITWKEILVWQMGYAITGRYTNRIIIPSFDKNGNLNYFIGRSYDGNSLRYFNSRASKNIIFNEYRMNWQKPVVIVEGVFDAIKVRGFNAVPLLGTELNEKTYLFQQLIEHRSKVFLALDPDARARQHRMARKLSSFGLDTISVEWKGQRDFGEMTTEEVEEILKLSDTDNFSDLDFIAQKILTV